MNLSIKQNANLPSTLLVSIFVLLISAGMQPNVQAAISPMTLSFQDDGEVRQEADPEDGKVQDEDQEPESDEDLGPTGSEVSEMELMVLVEELTRDLNARGISDRDLAERKLAHLGPTALEFLEVPDEATTDVRDRLLRVRTILEKAAVTAVTQSSTVTLDGTYALGDLFEELRKQTHNDVDLIGEAPIEVIDRELKVNFEETPFWTAMEDIMTRAHLDVATFQGEAGQLRLGPLQHQPGAAALEVPNGQAGVFDLRMTRVDSSRNLVRPAVNHSTFGMVVRWEPRVRPISVSLPLSSIKAIDEFDQEIRVSNPDIVVGGPVQPEIPELEFSIPMELVDRQVEMIKSMTGTIDAVLPGRIETFRFKNIGELEAGTSETRASATVEFGGVRKNDDVYAVTLQVAFDTTRDGMESYQGWVLDNEMYMLDDAGEKQSYIGLENFSRGEGKIGINFFFLDDPSNWTLVYRTPAAVVKVPIKIELKEIPLP